MRLDKQRRLIIPNCLLEATGILKSDNNKPSEIRIGIRQHYFLVFKKTDVTKNLEFSDVAHIDFKGRIILKKFVLQMAGLDDPFTTEFVVSAVQDKIIIRW